MLRAAGAVLARAAGGGGATCGIVAAAAAAAASRPFCSAAADAGKVGFVGLGRMGSRMVARLLDAGHTVVLHDSNALALERIARVGEEHPRGSIAVAASPAEVAATDGVGAVLTVVPDAPALASVFLGKDGLLRAPGGVAASLFINVTTIDPATARRLAEQVRQTPLAPAARPLTASGHPTLLDAPATGGVVGAEAGELTFAVGAAEAADVEAARPYLLALGNHVTHTGPVGSGSVAKLCNALVMSATMAAVSEALALAKRLHVDPAVVTDVLNSGSGRCWAAEKYNPVPGVVKGAPAGNGYRAGQGVDVVREQLLMLIRAGEQVHSPTPVAKFTEEQYRVMHDEGLGDKDFSAIYRYRYGSGCDNDEWKAGDQLFSAQIP